MEDHETRQQLSALAQRVGKQASSAEIADAIVAVWHEIDNVLTPILGQLGFAGLYRRSLQLTATHYPWLSMTSKDVQTNMDLIAVHAQFVKQNQVTAEAGGVALLQTFYELLITLVGPSLTEQLLCAVWDNSFSGSPAQDLSP